MELPYESQHRGRAGCEHVERGHDADEGREARVEVSHLWNRMAIGWQSVSHLWNRMAIRCNQ